MQSEPKYTEGFLNSQLNDVSSYRVNPMLNSFILGAALKDAYLNSDKESSEKTENSEGSH